MHNRDTKEVYNNWDLSYPLRKNVSENSIYVDIEEIYTISLISKESIRVQLV